MRCLGLGRLADPYADGFAVNAVEQTGITVSGPGKATGFWSDPLGFTFRPVRSAAMDDDRLML
ncbi:hypothetical protein ACRB68_53910 [Actinomadura sp. RB68]|uniref:Uncharacterized protein n=1 Tax=Actinomadura macrotermitis TaxID=2585200 RepID=A0A7K0C1E7_9ACTN|nr:hypothetical protein [Actinomadura macrotermitis]